MRFTQSRVTIVSAAFAAFMMSPTVTSFAQSPEAAWRKVCTKQADNDVCVVQNALVASTGQLLTAVGLITVQGAANNRLLQVTVPPARTIPPGVTMSIDGGQAQRIPYAVCMPDKCVAQVPLTDAIVNSFKGGGEVVFTSTNFQNVANPIAVSLGGFTAVYDGEAIDPSELQALEEQRREELQKKAEETSQRLIEEQQKAKEGN